MSQTKASHYLGGAGLHSGLILPSLPGRLNKVNEVIYRLEGQYNKRAIDARQPSRPHSTDGLLALSSVHLNEAAPNHHMVAVGP